MVDESRGREHCGGSGSEARVVLHGVVAGRPRCIRTVEGWEVASLLVGSGDLRGPEHGAVLVVCTGAGSSATVRRVAVGDRVIVLGHLEPRRASRPEDDAVELAADAVLARRGTVAVGSQAEEPRIAP
ncbi:MULTISPECIES: hypothetical protein [Clavibacter]|uniref:Single-stranded DNA-binding protein n=1 Tax=Clavibacter seminis TaxID=2860285 RepID=A0ABY3TDA2_9MICO|nr:MULTISPECIES: hypothetical protein [Clavibacter]UKF26531.1 hypothetical protein KYT88_07505 [Clavibacter sp. A6099]